mgnify:CR=1 FL=1
MAGADAYLGVAGAGGGAIYVGVGASLLLDKSALDSNTHCLGGAILADGPSVGFRTESDQPIFSSFSRMCSVPARSLLVQSGTRTP